MKPKTEEFLNFLLWSAIHLSRPTYRGLNFSYEEWVYRDGFNYQIKRLEKKKLVERNLTTSPDDRVYRLTAAGRLRALGGRDPAERWARPWDGFWRLVLFDIPNGHDAERIRLYRFLRDKGYGPLQKSVWITPDPLEEEAAIMADGKINVGSLALFKAETCGGESNPALVERAWNFAEINRHYSRHLKILDERPGGPLKNETTAQAFRDWAANEQAAWLKAVEHDPLLPNQILPTNYLGQKSWKRRTEVLEEAAKQLQTFQFKPATS